MSAIFPTTPSLLIFNPENDMALANGGNNYIAPALVRRMAADLELLPMWIYAKLPQASVLCEHTDEARAYVEAVGDLLQLGERVPQPVSPDKARERFSSSAGQPVPVRVNPWGWSRQLAYRMQKLGISARYLPTSSTLDAIRSLSGRMMTLELCKALNAQSISGINAEVTACYSPEDCRLYALSNEGVVFKQPYSSSGKGLKWCRGGMDELACQWVNTALQEMGYVIAMPIYNKVYDFSVLFQRMPDGIYMPVELMEFMTDDKGAYLGQKLQSREQLVNQILKDVPDLDFDRLLSTCVGFFHKYYQAYPEIAFIGIDMMVYEDEKGKRWVMPCIEINTRLTMGFVASYFYRKHVVPSAEGVFRVDSFRTHEALLERHKKDAANHPLRVENGRIRKGYFSLVPITAESLFRAYVIIG